MGVTIELQNSKHELLFLICSCYYIYIYMKIISYFYAFLTRQTRIMIENSSHTFMHGTVKITLILLLFL